MAYTVMIVVLSDPIMTCAFVDPVGKGLMSLRALVFPMTSGHARLNAPRRQWPWASACTVVELGGSIVAVSPHGEDEMSCTRVDAPALARL